MATDNYTLKTRLLSAGITPTQQRLRIARVVLDRPQHFSAEQVFSAINHDTCHVSKATVYNTLGLFARKGIIREVLVDPDRLLYDSNTEDHCHLYYEDTGELTDISASCLRLNALPELPDATEIVGIDVVIRVRHSR